MVAHGIINVMYLSPEQFGLPKTTVSYCREIAIYGEGFKLIVDIRQ